MTHMPAARILDQHHFAKGVGRLRQHRVENLLEYAIDRAHHRHAGDQAFTEADQEAPGDVGEQGADQRDQDERDHDADARHVPAQNVGGVVGVGDERHDGPVEEIDHQPEQPYRDADRRGDDDAGEEICPEAREEAAPARRLNETRRGARPPSSRGKAPVPRPPGVIDRPPHRPAIPLVVSLVYLPRCVAARLFVSGQRQHRSEIWVSPPAASWRGAAPHLSWRLTARLRPATGGNGAPHRGRSRCRDSLPLLRRRWGRSPAPTRARK